MPLYVAAPSAHRRLTPASDAQPSRPADPPPSRGRPGRLRGGQRMRQRLLRILMAAALAASAIGTTAAPAVMASSGSPGDARSSSRSTTATPAGATTRSSSRSTTTRRRPARRSTSTSRSAPSATRPWPASTRSSITIRLTSSPRAPTTRPPSSSMTADQVQSLGDELTDQIVAVDEAHYGEIGLADPADPNSDALVAARLQRAGRVVLRLRGHHLYRGLLRPGVHLGPRDERDGRRQLRLGQPDRRGG